MEKLVIRLNALICLGAVVSLASCGGNGNGSTVTIPAGSLNTVR